MTTNFSEILVLLTSKKNLQYLPLHRAKDYSVCLFVYYCFTSHLATTMIIWRCPCLLLTQTGRSSTILTLIVECSQRSNDYQLCDLIWSEAAGIDLTTSQSWGRHSTTTPPWLVNWTLKTCKVYSWKNKTKQYFLLCF